MFTFFKKLFDPTQATIKEAQPIVDEILLKAIDIERMPLEEMAQRIQFMRNELAPLIAKISEEQKLPLKPINFRDDKNEFAIHELLTTYIPEVFAYIREINRRKFGKPHFNVQLLAGVILAKGNKLTELKTGEGKTQVFHLPAALYGITQRGSHVITVNDYLARRDGEYAGHALADLGISVGIITPQASYKFIKDELLEATKGKDAADERKTINIANLSEMHGVNLQQCSKQEAYQQNVVYGTNNEFGFDYLRDNMVYSVAERSQKELYYCIIDEADSILIDEARTPLIISAPAQKSNELYEKFARIVEQLEETKHYTVNEKDRSATLTEEGVVRVEKILGISNLWQDYQYAHHLDNALKAKALFKIDDQYIVQNGEILIVDEFTGRVLPGRRYSEGLHQAIEAKEKVEIKKESKTLATITFQNFFKLYKVIGGGSGTIITEAEEFLKIYNLESYIIPTNIPIKRKDLTDKIYKDKAIKFNAVVEEVVNIHKSGQPILIGTATIEDSELVSRMLDKKGVQHEVLNAKFHEKEAQIIAKAGNTNAVTVATNMAGRGTDIPLQKGVQELGGLYVIGTERHDARRIDNQLRGRSGRQGDPGKTQFFVALDDEVMRVQGGDMVKRIMEMTNLPTDIPLENSLISRAIENAQKKMEGYHFDVRKRVVDYDNVMNQQREIFYTKRLDSIKESDVNVLLNKISKYIEDYCTRLIDKHYDLTTQKLKLIDLQNEIYEFIDKKEFENITKDLNLNLTWDDSQVDLLENNLVLVLNMYLKNKAQNIGDSFVNIAKIIALQTLDALWTEHLESISDLREGIGLRGYAQRDPLVEYKNEAFLLFEGFMSKVNDQIVLGLLRLRRNTEVQTTKLNKLLGDSFTNENEISDINTGNREMSINSKKAEKTPSIINRTHIKDVIGRNEPCPCGSGLKYKKCGLINSPQHKH